MDYAALGSDDFFSAAQALLPPGRAFTRDPASTLSGYLRGLADVIYELHTEIVDLFGVEADPGQADILLPEWQQVFGAIAKGSLDQQHALLVATIGDPGGFSGAHYVALAASLGISAATQVTAPFAWTLHAPAALSSDDRASLEALIRSHNRASCTVTFSYDL